jgi:hypothetical protein
MFARFLSPVAGPLVVGGLIAGALVAGAFCLAGCVVEVHTGPARHETREFARKGVERLRLNLQMGAGQVNIRGGASQLARADIAYNVDRWKPDVIYHTLGGSSYLSIEQPGTTGTHLGGNTYTWDIQLADDVPTEITAHLGAGDARMNLGGLSLRRVEVEMGVGELKMDLRGTPTNDYNVRVSGGVGEATVYLPRDTGVYATGHGGIGEIHTEGLRRQDDHWVNDAYKDAKVRIHVDVEGGIGQINLIAN